MTTPSHSGQVVAAEREARWCGVMWGSHCLSSVRKRCLGCETGWDGCVVMHRPTPSCCTTMVQWADGCCILHTHTHTRSTTIRVTCSSETRASLISCPSWCLASWNLQLHYHIPPCPNCHVPGTLLGLNKTFNHETPKGFLHTTNYASYIFILSLFSTPALLSNSYIFTAFIL